MLKRFARHAAVGIALTLLTGCAAPERGEPPTRPLRVMTFNIEWGGTHVDFAKVIEAIRAADPDIVGIQEAEGNLGRIAATLGWQANRRHYVISRFPLVAPPGNDGRYLYVEIAPGRIVAVANLHLPSDPYGPDAVRDHASRDEVLALERRTRLPGIAALLPGLTRLADNGVPVFLTGDFNSPSHEDWTPRAVGARPFLRYALAWPVTRAAAEAGFRDAWRSIYPDPVANPGLTWWARRPPIPAYAPGPSDAEDRIDYVWFAGPVEVLAARLVGEAGRDAVAHGVAPWPSDHRAVVADFSVQPAAMPDLVVAGRRVYRRGEAVTLRRHGMSDADRRVLVTEAGPGRTVGDAVLPPGGSFAMPGETLAAGRYAVAYFDERDDPHRRSEFWVLAAGSRPALSVDGARFAVGDAIPVRWKNGPGHRNDYLAAYPAGTAAEYENSLLWTYVNAQPAGSLALDATTVAAGWPLAAGRYVLRLMEDDGATVLAESAAFTIAAD